MTSPTYYMDVYLDSRQRTSGSINNCTFNLSIPIQKALSVTLKSFQCYNSQYNINTTNNTLVVSTVGTVSIAAGFYDSSTLMSTLQSGLNALNSGTWTVAYSSTTGLVTISVNTSKTIDWATSTIATVIGFSQSGTQTGTTFTSSNILNLSSSNYIIVKSLNMVENYNSMTLTGPNNILEKIPINVPSGSLINYICNNTELCYVEFSSPRTVPVIDIQLTDIHGNSLNFLTDWSVVFQFEIEDA